jgi:Mrp family chromosome partitioning ATPase
MPAGTGGGNNRAFEEIANGAFKAFISQLLMQCNFNVILVDSPPVLSRADATIIAGQVNGTIMVEREHLSRRTDVVEALTRLGSARGRLMGTVFVGSSDREEHAHASGYDR